ncbi:MAG: RTX toxin, partial [Pseudomonadota bacterium]|nr:RTX toxin [Pseudomonadota bacterium]
SRPVAPDRIFGFEHAIDKIDLARIDADTTAAGNQAFTFIGSAPFSGSGNASAGQLRAEQIDAAANIWRVEGDVNGDGIADLVIQVHVEAGQPLTASDFVF